MWKPLIHISTVQDNASPNSDVTLNGDQDIVVRQAREGNVAAFERLYRENVGRVFGVCRRMLSDTTEAEELTQVTFVRAWEMLGGFRGESAFSSWIHRIAVNAVLVHVRSKQRRLLRVFSTHEFEDGDHQGHSPSAGEAIDLENALSVLPAQARMVFILHDVEGYKHQEIARMMQIAPGTSKSQLHRARTRLKELLT